MNLRKIPISSTEKASIVRDLIKIINEFEKKYKAAFLLRDLIENEYQSVINQRIDEIKRNQTLISYEIFNEDVILVNLTKKKKDKDEMFKKIREVAENHYIFYFEFFLKLFKVILDICDFLKGGTIDEIASSHGFSPKYTTSIAKIIFQDNSINAEFLDKCIDIKKFAAIANIFKIDYLSSRGAIRFYIPDFVAVQEIQNKKVYWIIETKGREYPDTRRKDNAMNKWCNDVSDQVNEEWKYLKVLQSNFNKFKKRKVYKKFLDLIEFLETNSIELCQ